MKINTKVRYGVRTMIEIAMHWNKKGIYQKEISKRQEISFKYLDHIISALKASGLIQNADGRGSGYILGRSPEKITVFDIYRAFEDDPRINEKLSSGGEYISDPVSATKDFWGEFNRNMVDFMDATTLAVLAKKQKEIEKSEELNMFYI